MTKGAHAAAPGGTLSGFIVKFDAERGYGFIRPEGVTDDNHDVFVHISNVEGRQAPREGQRVTYQVIQGTRRPEAVHVEQGSVLSVPRWRFAAIGIGGAVVLWIALVWVLSRLGMPAWPQLWLTLWIVAMSVATFFLYGYDKAQAGKGGLRVPEFVLRILLPFLGGGIGALYGMRHFHHKTIKWGSGGIIWLSVVLWLGVLVVLFFLGVQG
jgi:uncharacterized membrane protein YsdA (DUF1294 family)/cold shock CspA family protein